MHWTIAPTPVDSHEAAATIRGYVAELADRYYGRPATAEEVDEALGEEPDAGMAPPHGLFLLARTRGGTDADAGRAGSGSGADTVDVGGVVGVVGCVGVQLLDAETAELRRVWVAPPVRGCGLADLLLAAAEDAARELGAGLMRLDTRRDLVEAKRLYVRHGYTETPPYNDSPYADHWFAKSLRLP